MDFEYKLKMLELEVKAALTKLKDAEALTARVLAIAEKYGETIVGINKSDERLVGSKDWDGRGMGHCLFAVGLDEGGYPNVWRIAEEAGIYAGCGNYNQAQIIAECVVDGVYELRDGKWSRH